MSRTIRMLGALFCVAIASGSLATAQARFEVLKQDVLAGASGLRVMTIRDNDIAQCYTLFMTEPALSTEAARPTAAPVDPAQQESIRRIREAAENYDRQVAALNAQFEAKVGRPPRDTWDNLSGWPYTFTSVVQYELDRARIANEYERALQSEIPSSAPFATSAPGMKTGSWQDLAEAVRRGVANPAPATQQTIADPGGLGPLLEAGFQRLTEAPRLAASGPTPCESGSNR